MSHNSTRPNPIRLNTPNNVQGFLDERTLAQWQKESANVTAKERDNDANTITIYGPIGYDFWTGDGVTHKRIAAALRSIGQNDVTVNINSPGGDVFEGVGILNELLNHPGKVTVNVVSMAASAASLIAMAGDEILISKGSLMMLHEAMSGVYGTAENMSEVSEFVGKVTAMMAEVYAERSNKTVEEISAMMSKGSMNLGTYLTADEAIEAGLADGHYTGETLEVDVDANLDADLTRRQLETVMTRNGASRTDARSFLNRFSGKQDATQNGTQDATDPELAKSIAALTADFRK